MSKKTLNGGETVVKLYGTKHMTKIGRKGGLATARRYGSDYLSAIGSIGADSVNGHLSNWKYNRLRGKINRILKTN